MKEDKILKGIKEWARVAWREHWMNPGTFDGKIATGKNKIWEDKEELESSLINYILN